MTFGDVDEWLALFVVAWLTSKTTGQVADKMKMVKEDVVPTINQLRLRKSAANLN
jgi:hypothetical protein